MTEETDSMLSPYRVLDLADDTGLLCSKILGDLGADVIKIEKPGGDAARCQGPYYKDDPNPEKSLFWFAYNTSKRGITLDIETSDGLEILKKLVKTADIVVETYRPGYLDSLGLGYSELEKINPGIILASITPFGQTGPYKDYKTADIVAWGMGGYMYTLGEADRPPIQIGHHSQPYLHAGGQAAQGALMALFHREITGEGQQVDVSIQDCIVRCTPERITQAWDFDKRIVHRGGGGRLVRSRRIWQCKDGYVFSFFWSGPDAVRWNTPIVTFMDSEGMADDFIKNFDWSTFNLQDTTQEMLDRLAEPVSKFFISKTKAELLEGALKFNAQLYPVADASDIAANPQLTAREYWVELEHPELNDTINYPGAFGKTTEAQPRLSRRAPLVGEHNMEIYEDELGISNEKIQSLKKAGII
ncbi:CaiB/BaiF CoA transferase family protein [Chloroflexota bacterium]